MNSERMDTIYTSSGLFNRVVEAIPLWMLGWKLIRKTAHRQMWCRGRCQRFTKEEVMSLPETELFRTCACEFAKRVRGFDSEVAYPDVYQSEIWPLLQLNAVEIYPELMSVKLRKVRHGSGTVHKWVFNREKRGFVVGPRGGPCMVYLSQKGAKDPWVVFEEFAHAHVRPLMTGQPAERYVCHRDIFRTFEVSSFFGSFSEFRAALGYDPDVAKHHSVVLDHIENRNEDCRLQQLIEDSPIDCFCEGLPPSGLR